MYVFEIQKFSADHAPAPHKVVRALEPSLGLPIILKSIKVIKKLFHISGLRENLDASRFPASMILALNPPPPAPSPFQLRFLPREKCLKMGLIC